MDVFKMINKFLLLLLSTTISSSIFASEEIIFKCDTTPNGYIEITRNQSLYKVNIIKNNNNILNVKKDYKKNTENSFIKFNYSNGQTGVATGFVIGYLGKKRSLHTISSDEYTTYRVGYDIDNNNILSCINNEKYINKFKEIDKGLSKKGSIPPFYYD